MLALVSDSAELIGIFSAALNQLESDLHASDTDISTTISTFIIVQGGGPLFWSAVSEVKGRKVGRTIVLVGTVFHENNVFSLSISLRRVYDLSLLHCVYAD